jgi:hypothetical protein
MHVEVVVLVVQFVDVLACMTDACDTQMHATHRCI